MHSYSYPLPYNGNSGCYTLVYNHNAKTNQLCGFGVWSLRSRLVPPLCHRTKVPYYHSLADWPVTSHSTSARLMSRFFPAWFTTSMSATQL